MTFDAVPLLKIGDQSVSLGRVLQYFQLSGKLAPWIKDVVEQHIIFQAIQSRDDLDVLESEIDQAIIDFRLGNQLSDGADFEQWLNNQAMDFVTLKNRFVLGYKIEKLKTRVTEAALPEFFAQQKSALDQVELYYMIATSQSLAEEIRNRLWQEGTRFEQVAKEYALAEDPQVSLVRRSFSFAQLPENLRQAVEGANVNDILGAMEVEQRWCVFRIEQFSPAVLEGQLKQSLQDQLFQRWLDQQVQQSAISLDVPPPDAPPVTEVAERELAMAY
jgi:PPIC-type PPIASE domain